MILNTFMTNSRLLLIIQLFLVPLELFSLPIYLEPLPRFGATYFASTFYAYVVNFGVINPEEVFYHNWPSYSIFGAILHFMALSTRYDYIVFLKAYPVVLNIIYTITIYGIFKKLSNKEKKLYFVLLFSALNWVNQSYFSPQSLGYSMLLIILLLILIAAEKYDKKYYILLSILLFGIVSTHMLSSFILLVFLIINLVVYVQFPCFKQAKSVFWVAIFLLVLFIGWHVWVSYPGYVSKNIRSIIKNIYSLIRFEFSSRHTAIGATMMRIGGNTTHFIVTKAMIFFAVSTTLMSISGFLEKTRNKWLTKSDILWILYSFSVIIGVLIAGRYGGEGLARAYFFLIPSFLWFISENANWKNIGISMLIIFILMSPLLHIFTQYGNESFESVPTLEFAGKNFCKSLFNNKNEFDLLPSCNLDSGKIFYNRAYNRAKAYGNLLLYVIDMKKAKLKNNVVYNSKASFKEAFTLITLGEQ